MHARQTRLLSEQWREICSTAWTDAALLNTWLKHQRRDDFWKHGSVCEDYSAITCAVYAIGGWADGYTNAVPRLLSGLTCPRKGLIGPWSHQFPETAIPGPMVGFLRESLRWWDYWLKDAPTGIMDEPMFAGLYMQDSAPRQARVHSERAGRWVAEEEWPPRRRPAADARARPRRPARGGRPGRPSSRSSAVQTAGLDAGVVVPVRRGRPTGRATSAPMDGMSAHVHVGAARRAARDPGLPEVDARARRPTARSRSCACACARCAPDGASPLVTRALQNLTHRDERRAPGGARPGRALHGDDPARRDRPRLRSREPHPGRGLADATGRGPGLRPSR